MEKLKETFLLTGVNSIHSTHESLYFEVNVKQKHMFNEGTDEKNKHLCKLESTVSNCSRKFYILMLG